MSITYKELKDRMTDLGFEEDDVAEEEYKRIYMNSFNRAGEIIYDVVMLAVEGYIRKELGIERTDWRGVEVPLPRITRITENTADTDEIEIIDELVPLYTLLAAHYAWLDDDIAKATMYWNEFDSLKNEFIANASRPRRAEIIGGF
jgi:hypothetical protein